MTGGQDQTAAPEMIDEFAGDVADEGDDEFTSAPPVVETRTRSSRASELGALPWMVNSSSDEDESDFGLSPGARTEAKSGGFMEGGDLRSQRLRGSGSSRQSVNDIDVEISSERDLPNPPTPPSEAETELQEEEEAETEAEHILRLLQGRVPWLTERIRSPVGRDVYSTSLHP